MNALPALAGGDGARQNVATKIVWVIILIILNICISYLVAGLNQEGCVLVEKLV